MLSTFSIRIISKVIIVVLNSQSDNSNNFAMFEYRADSWSFLRNCILCLLVCLAIIFLKARHALLGKWNWFLQNSYTSVSCDSCIHLSVSPVLRGAIFPVTLLLCWIKEKLLLFRLFSFFLVMWMGVTSSKFHIWWVRNWKCLFIFIFTEYTVLSQMMFEQMRERVNYWMNAIHDWQNYITIEGEQWIKTDIHVKYCFPFYPLVLSLACVGSELRSDLQLWNILAILLYWVLFYYLNYQWLIYIVIWRSSSSTRYSRDNNT